LSHAADVVLEGVPGTGKTHAVERLKNATLTTREKRTLSRVDIRFMTMHPSTSYEDFVEGLRPAGAWQNTVAAVKIESNSRGPWFCGPPSPVPSGSLPIEAADDAAGNQPADRSGVVARATFAIKNGFFVEACVAAVDDPKAAVVVVLDELNRCNIPKVLGDLLTVIEESKRVEWGQHGWHVEGAAQAVTLPYSGRRLFVPDNLFIVGTMNTTDRSVAPMDAALRRRFSFHRLFPQGFELTSPNKDELLSRLKQTAGVTHDDIMTRSHSLWSKVNQIFCDRYGADAMLGHSYLDDLARALKAAKNMDPVDPIVHYHWNHRILPQLMDTIASNGLMRALVSDPASFFADEPAKGGELAPVP
jgi:5-methylcytosine-specific restriction endonuclease McrBC GTP-binding regulatory subunit McrB